VYASKNGGAGAYGNTTYSDGSTYTIEVTPIGAKFYVNSTLLHFIEETPATGYYRLYASLIKTSDSITDISFDYAALGPTGTTGPTGSTGTTGSAGTKIYSGTGAPAEEIGVSGDFYIDLLTGTFYGPKP
jgi:hypothetical protein